MRVLLACEESQTVCKEFRRIGHEAFSCDIKNCSGGKPEWHIKGDVIDVINDGWDLMISFPPCTHLAVSGAAWFDEKIKDGRQQQGIDFFMKMVNAPINKIAIENPVGIMSNKYKKPTQIIQPYYFGDEFQKTTCLWLKGLNPLVHQESDDLFNKKTWVDRGEMTTFTSGKVMPKWYAELSGNGGERSKTFPGIAKAMANQWG